MSECEKCKEYDTEKHHCEKFCKVITNTIVDAMESARKDALSKVCAKFKEDWEEQCEGGMEGCVNWYKWLLSYIDDVLFEMKEQK